MRSLESGYSATVRQRAVLLLEQLMMERERLEAALSERSRADQLKSVTGSSSLDCAIGSTRRMIADLDASAALIAQPPAERHRSRPLVIATRVSSARPVSVGV
jgi:hypothetical protein